jgi:hypothetical protein
MTAFRKPLAIESVGVTPLGLRSDLPHVERVVTAGCHNQSAGCMIEIRYSYRSGDLSVVPPDIYF